MMKHLTPELVRHYIRKFDEGRDGLVDKALFELFRAFPENTRLEHILLKVLSLNALHSAGIVDVHPVAKHIARLSIDEKLAEGSAELVNNLARNSNGDGKMRRNYSFASKYCSWHFPNAFPIYDSIVGKLVSEYQQLDRFTDTTWQHDLTDYLAFKRTIEAFRDSYGLSEFSFKELDKFLWLYGKEYFGKSAIRSEKAG
jgi:hypothetical protein